MNMNQTRRFNTMASVRVAAGMALSAADSFGGGGGGGGGGMQISAPGVYVVDIPGPGEASMIGTYSAYLIAAMLSGGKGTPADTVVTVNGAALVHAPGLAPGYFKLDPAGPQPAPLGADGFLHIVATSASAKATRQLDLACPARLVETSVPAPGTSLAGVTTLEMAWSPFPANPAGGPGVHLRSYDLATGTSGSVLSGGAVDLAWTGASLPVVPTASTGYVSELIYSGVYHLDGNSGGVCGRVLRYTYTN